MTFNYQISLSSLRAAIVMVALVAIGTGYLAVTNDVGLGVRKIIYLTADQATAVYALLAVANTVGAGLLTFQALWVAREGVRQVALMENRAVVPRRGLRQVMIEIPYADVRSHDCVILPNDDMLLTIKSSVGVAALSASGFESSEAFARFEDALATRVAGR